jgi:energy-coupling factor transport system substrate-specific component
MVYFLYLIKEVFIMADKKIISVRTVVAIGIGAALTFVFMKFVRLPSPVPATYLILSPAIIAIFAGIFGPIAGFLIALIGHVISDLTGGGVWWSWAIANGIFGLLVGTFWKFYRLDEGDFTFKNCLIFNAVQILANAIAWIGIAPTLDILIYAEPADKVYLQGLAAGAMNAGVVLILGSILAFGYSKTRTKAGSLKAE